MSLDAPKKYLIVKGIAGLGNRLLTLANAAIYAKLTDRFVIVDWSDDCYSNANENSFGHLFESPIFNSNMIILNEICDKSIYPIFWKNNLKETVHSVRKKCGLEKLTVIQNLTKILSIDLNNLNYTEDVLVYFDTSFKRNFFNKNSKTILSFWPVSNHEQYLKYFFEKLIYPTSILQNKILDFKKNHFNRVTIGVHIRHTDNNKLIWKFIDVNSIYQKLDILLLENKDIPIFLATDNVSILKFFKNKYSVVITMEKTFAPCEGCSIHHSKLQNKIDTAKEAVIEMYLLANCDYLIYSSKSSFGKISSLLTKLQSKYIVDIDRNVITSLLPVLKDCLKN